MQRSYRRRSVLLATAALCGCGVRIAGAAPGPADPVRNVLTLRSVSGGARDYPVRIGRPFAQGEITGVPCAVLNGARLPTQADVKTRWPDGSVQHAVLSFIVPRVPGMGGIEIGFVNQPVTQAAPIDLQQMLESAFDFDAVMELAQGSEVRRASARAMLAAGAFSVWCQGPIATTVVIADHSAARKYDIGFDNLRSVRPIFHATFWPALRKAHVRVIGENANTQTLQDMQYSLVLRAGAAAPKEVFRQEAVPHYAATRWTRSFWTGGEPEAVDVDHNLAYLAATRAFPNFDTSLRVPDHVVGETYGKWERLPHGLYDEGGWTKFMPETGGRDDIGPYPGGAAKWLYTGDHRLFEMVSTMADLAGAWPVHVREGDPAKRFDAQRQVPAIGRVISVHARPNVWLFDQRDPSGPDQHVVIQGTRIQASKGPKFGGGWINDGGHQPDPYSALYTLTGDPFALEQMQFWAATQALWYDPALKGIPASGIFMDQTRGNAWVLRNRVHAAFLSPDGTPEKPYFASLVDDAVAAWEGRLGVRDARFENTPAWRFGDSHPYKSPLHFMRQWKIRPGERGMNEHASAVDGLWQYYMLIFELARAKEKGFATGPLLSWLSELLTGHFTQGRGYDPWNCLRYYTAVKDENDEFYKNWPDTLVAFKEREPKAFKGDIRDGYGAYAYAASAMIVAEPGGRVAFDWLRRAIYEPLRAKYAEYPKWAFVPRA